MPRIRAILATLGLLAGLSLLTACSEGSVFSLEIGDCFNDPADGVTEASSVEMVDCADPHDNEVYGEGTMTDEVYPGDDAISEFAEQVCYDAFEGYVGLTYSDSALDYWYWVPTQETWTQSRDRLITCVLYNPSSQTVGTFKGSKI